MGERHSTDYEQFGRKWRARFDDDYEQSNEDYDPGEYYPAVSGDEVEGPEFDEVGLVVESDTRVVMDEFYQIGSQIVRCRRGSRT